MTRANAIAVLLVFAALTSVAKSLPAETFAESFDEGSVGWRLELEPKTIRPLDHRRQPDAFREGKGAELARMQVTTPGGEAAFSHALPPAAAIADLRLSVWLKSNQAGFRMGMRLVFPGETDPETGGPLTALILGDGYSTPDEWQQLTCVASADAVRDAVRRTRYRFPGREISDQGLYADQAIVTANLTPQAAPVEVLFDDLTFGPVITPARTNELATAGPEPPAGSDSPVQFRLNRLTVEGTPFFPVIAPYHVQYAGSFDDWSGEDLAVFAGTGVNVAWIKDYRDDGLLRRLREAGLWATAIPPRPPGEGEQPLDAQQAGLLPFGPETRPILFWNLGPRIPSHTLEQLIGWVDQIHAADAAFDRPVLADVSGSEYAFSNHVDMLAVSRHITNSSITYENYRDWLRSRRGEAFLNTFFWTWVQTEPVSQMVAARDAARQLPVIIEPEQIRLQVYAALQAGCRGIGYWKTIPFHADAPGTEERRLALARLNMELKLLEPLLATCGKPGTPNPFNVEQVLPGSTGRRARPSYHQITMTGPAAAETPFAPTERAAGKADAVVLKTDLGPLLIAVWYGESAQFCPGQMAKNDVKIVVPGVEQTAAAWLLTPTGVHHLTHRRVTGGMEISLPKFDQTAAVLFTADPSVAGRFERAAAQMAPQAAQVSVDLAKAKRIRVAEVHRQLTALAHPLPDGDAILRRADQLIAAGIAALGRGDHDGARASADDAMQMLRVLQRAHWEDAVRQFRSPLASPHAVSFSTLPDHYRLIAKVGRNIMATPEDANLLPSGRFEDVGEMVEEGWRHTAVNSAALVTDAAIVAADPKQGAYSLQLVARRREGGVAVRGEPEGSVTFRSPAMNVTAGQVLHISGWIRIVRPIPEHLDGVTIHDSLLGPSSGLRWTTTAGWEQFQMLREVPQHGEFTLTLTLHGEGEAHFDDLRVVPHTPRDSIAQQPGPAATQ